MVGSVSLSLSLSYVSKHMYQPKRSEKTLPKKRYINYCSTFGGMTMWLYTPQKMVDTSYIYARCLAFLVHAKHLCSRWTVSPPLPITWRWWRPSSSEDPVEAPTKARFDQQKSAMSSCHHVISTNSDFTWISWKSGWQKQNITKCISEFPSNSTEFNKEYIYIYIMI